MKVFNSFLTISTTVLILVSCSNGTGNSQATEKSKNSAKSDTSKTEEAQPIYVPTIVKGKVTKSLSAGETSETSRIYFEYYELEDKSPLYVKSVNELISKIVQSDFEETNTNKITSKLTKSYFAKILTNFKNDFSEIDEEYMPWSILDSVHIDDSKTEFVHVEGFTYSFTGGAHGNGYESHTLISKETGKALGLTDVFKNQKKLNMLVDQYFRKTMGIAANANYEDEGFFIEGKLKANGNFYFTDKHVVFLYNTYEVGPYVIGAPSVEIPLTKINDILNLKLN
jgi:hypothetical protein